jgi:HD-like signal output (HDOD) protein
MLNQEDLMKSRILFVDDEPNLINGLRRMLRRMRHVWDVSFVTSGEQALKILANEHYDVIVSDMRMPMMDGNQLLSEIKKKYPHMVRIILSGHSDMEKNLKSVMVAHQYLSKPCSAEELTTTIRRACELRETLCNEKVLDIVSTIENIPSQPALYREIVEELESPYTSMKVVGEIISKDIWMTAKILQVINSAFFGLPQHISDPRQAVVFLGLDAIKGLVLAAGVFSSFDEHSARGLSIDRLWSHSIAVGSLARKIARGESCEQQMVDDSLVAGMLHDIGRLLIAVNLPEQYSETLAIAHENNCALWKAEREILGTTHSEIGAYLIGLWGLTDSIIEALAFHHYPERGYKKTFVPLTAVHVADAMEHENAETNKSGDPTETTINSTYLSELGLMERLPKWRIVCKS